MKTEFVACKDRRTAMRRCPWAAVTLKVDGGYRCWESVADYQTWTQQQ